MGGALIVALPPLQESRTLLSRVALLRFRILL